MRYQRFSRGTGRSRLTPSAAMAIAFLALMVALGGTSLGRSIAGSSSARHAAKATSVRRGPRGPAGPRGPRGPAGSTGLAGPAGAPGSAFAYAHVTADGKVDPAASKNVEINDLTIAGVWCLKVTGGTPKNVTAMIDNAGANPLTSQIGGTTVASAISKTCPSGNNVEIVTGSAGSFTPLPFYVAIN